MENTPNNKVENSPEVQNPSRRRLLKFLAAGGAVTAVSLLPGKWSSPSIKSGVLPAHAQVTQQQYEIQCGAWDWELIPDEPNSRYEFTGTATAMDITNNLPLGNVRLVASALIAPLTFRSDFGDTDSSGVASFVITADFPDVQFPSIDIKVNFDSLQYGDDTCETRIFIEEN
jgi:hypothetical protein